MPDAPNDPTVGFQPPADGLTAALPSADGADTLNQVPRPPGPATERIEPGPFPVIPGYEIECELGHGGMGVVYKARQFGLNRPVALKMVLAGTHAKADELVRFLAEAETAARLRHQGIVQVYESGRHGGLPYFTMEFVDGGSLADRLARSAGSSADRTGQREGGPLAPAEAARVALLLAEAVAHAHAAGVVHRDLKPANILLAADGTPKITDFGLAKRLEVGDGLTRTGSVLGTPSYMPPEQARGDLKSVGPPGDVYALGAILYELLTGRPPFRSDSVMNTLSLVLKSPPARPRAVNAAVPRDLETVALKCLEKEPGNRYASADALADDLRRFLEGRAILARRASAAEKLARWAKRNPAVAGLLAAVFVTLTAGVVVSSVLAVRAADRAREARDALAKEADAAAAARVALAKEAEATAAARAALAKEEQATRTAREATESTRRQLVRAAIGNGQRARDAGDPAAAALWFIRAWEADRAEARNEPVHRLRLGLTLDAYPPLVGACFHTAPVTDADLSADGTRLVTRTGPGAAALWDMPSGTKIADLAHAGPVRHVAFHPDGGAVVTVSDDRTAKVWDGHTGRLRHTFAHPGPVATAAFHPKKPTLATAAGNVVRFWDAAGGRPTGVEATAPAEVTRLAFNADGSRLLTADQGGSARRWDPDTGAAVGPPMSHRPLGRDDREFDYKLAPLFLPDGERVLTVGPKDVTLWDGNGKPVWSKTVTAEPRHLATSWDGRSVALAFGSGVRVFDAATGAVRCTIAAPREVQYVAFAPGGALAGLSSGGLIQTWNPDTGTPAGPEWRMADFGRQLRYSPDGRYLVAAGQDGVARVWETAAPQPEAVIVPAWQPNRSADARRVAQRTPEGVVVRDMTTGAVLFGPIQKVDAGPRIFRPSATDGVVSNFALSPDGRQLAAGIESSGELFLFDVDSGRVLHRPQAFRGFPTAMVYSGDGRRVAVAGTDTTVRLWGASTGRPAGPFLRHSLMINNVRIAPDGRTLATLDFGKVVRLWDGETGDLLAGFTAEALLNFTRDGRWLAVKGRPPIRMTSFPAAIERAAPLAHLLTGVRLDPETDGVEFLPQDTFLKNPEPYRKAWRAWRGLPDRPAAQPNP